MEGETPQQNRTRVSNAITSLLEEDELLRQEVAYTLALHESMLDYTKRRESTPLTDEESLFEEC